MCCFLIMELTNIVLLEWHSKAGCMMKTAIAIVVSDEHRAMLENMVRIPEPPGIQ